MPKGTELLGLFNQGHVNFQSVFLFEVRQVSTPWASKLRR